MVSYKNKKYVCLLDFAMDFIRGKWKAVLLCHPKRFLELQRLTKGISHKAMNGKLREWEDEDLIHKKIYAEIPPRVEYYLTDKGRELTAMYLRFSLH